MMEILKEYIMTVVSASILCGIITTLAGRKTAAAPILRLVLGVFLCLTIIKPLANIKLKDLSAYPTGLNLDAQATAAIGSDLYRESLRQVIKENTQAYILDKAQAMNLALNVRVHLNEDSVPDALTLTGDASPEAKETLVEILESELDIPKERQIWIG